MSNKGGRGQQRHQEANTTRVIKTSTLTLTRTPKPCYIRRSLFILFITFVLSSLFFLALLYSFFSIFLFLFASFFFLFLSSFFPAIFPFISALVRIFSWSPLLHFLFHILNLFSFFTFFFIPSFRYYSSLPSPLFTFLVIFPFSYFAILSCLLSSTCTVSHFYFFSLLPLFLLAPSFALNYLSRHFPNYLHPLY